MNKPHNEYRITRNIDADLLPKRVPKKIRNIIASIPPNSIVSSISIVNKYGNQLGRISDNYPRDVISIALVAACRMNMAEKINDNSIPSWFYALDTISYWQSQLRGSRYKNAKDIGMAGTRPVYLYHLWNFNRWLKGRTFKITALYSTSNHAFTQRTIEHSFQTVEDVLYLLDQPMIDSKNIVRIIKQYLLDPMHSHKKATYMDSIKNAIQSYFVKNDREIHISYNPKNMHSTESEEQSMSLSDLAKFLMVSTLTEKAVFLSKFQRGLDASTLVDRFNFVVWDQLVDYFGNIDHNEWDLSRCPVPIQCVRMKTDFKHIGFLDHDAVDTIIEYLDYRQTIVGKPMCSGQPLFLNSFGDPITTTWVFRSFAKLAKKSAIQNCKEVDGKRFYKLDSHELRDLLKSTLIDSGCRIDVAEHVIGHKPRDSYEKQSTLYPETLRHEYAKASLRLNLVSMIDSIHGKFDNNSQQNILNTAENVQSVAKDDIQINLHNSVHRYVHNYLQHTLQNHTSNYTQPTQCTAQNNIENVEYAQVQYQIDALQNAVSELSKLFHQNTYCPNCRTIHVKIRHKTAQSNTQH